MDFAHSERTVELRKLLQDFVDHQVRPGDSELRGCAALASSRSLAVVNVNQPTEQLGDVSADGVPAIIVAEEITKPAVPEISALWTSRGESFG